MQFDFGEDEVTLESLHRQRNVITLESNAPSQAIAAMTSRLPKFLADVKDFIGRHIRPFGQSVNLVDSRKLEARFKTLDYITASNLGVFVPGGFKGQWLPYTEVLNRSQAIIDVLRKDLLNPFETHLSVLLTDHSHLRDNNLGGSLSRYKKNDLEALKKDFNKFFTGNLSVTDATYGDVVGRHADLPQVSKTLNDINLRFAAVDRTDLLKQVDRISEYLGTLIHNLENHPDEYTISAAMLQALVNLTYTMAGEVEYYTVHGYFLDAFTVSVRDSYKHLEKAVIR